MHYLQLFMFKVIYFCGNPKATQVQIVHGGLQVRSCVLGVVMSFL